MNHSPPDRHAPGSPPREHRHPSEGRHVSEGRLRSEHRHSSAARPRRGNREAPDPTVPGSGRPSECHLLTGDQPGPLPSEVPSEVPFELASDLPSEDLLRGLRDFQRDAAPLLRPELARLAREGQSPGQLFLTCADSRVVPNVITSSGPGDLFTVRNIGNLVPSGYADHSVGAAIEYAVDILRVRTITVCGHSGCGAMQALLDGVQRRPGASTPLARWLRNGRDALHRARRAPVRIAGRQSADPLEELCLANVAQQLDNLRAHPSVRPRLDEGSLQLAGLYFDLAAAQAYLLAPSGEGFVPVAANEDPAA
jgi:carbonic anhydrase